VALKDEGSKMNWSDAPNKRYLDVKEVAKEYGLAVSTVYAMVSQHRIPFFKMGRRTKFDRLQLDKWILANTVNPRGQIQP
jgi:excisionase family DNA binding protein